MVGVIDIDVGNLGSILNILKMLDVECTVIKHKGQLASCDRFILPGVGAFDSVMDKLHSSGLVEGLEQQVCNEGKYYLGICVGAQLLCQSSEEGNMAGLGWMDNQVKKFSPQKVSKIPHMGWNTIDVVADNATVEHPIYQNILGSHSRFYFLHSYYIELNESSTLCTTEYGDKFSSIILKDNIIGTQFHPEKSHKYGIQLIQNFLELTS